MMRKLPLLPTVALLAGTALTAYGLYIPAKAEMAQWLLQQAWEKRLAGADDARPWPWADTQPLARISIPDLNKNWIVMSGAHGRTLAFAPGHLEGSALPGRPGHSIVSAHRDTHFQALQQLSPDASIHVQEQNGAVSKYRVTDIRVVDSRKTRLSLNSDGRHLTLVTCYPFEARQAGGPLRFVVHAEAEGSKTKDA